MALARVACAVHKRENYSEHGIARRACRIKKMPVRVVPGRASCSIRFFPRSLRARLFFFLFCLGGFGLSRLFLLFSFLELGAQQFEDGQLRAIADPEARAHDSRVAARAIGKARCDVGEKFLGGSRRHEIRGGLPARLQRVALAESNQLLDQRTRGLCPSDRGGDAFLLDDVGHEVAERGAAMRRLASEFRSIVAVSHTWVPR